MFWKKKNKGNGQNPPVLPVITDLDIVIRTDLGAVRTNNEDAVLFRRVAEERIVREKGCLLVVADGMGGHNAGEVASNMAVEIISQEYFKSGPETSLEKRLKKAFATANKKIYAAGAAGTGNQGMGTTCTAIVFAGPEIYYAHAGDSRAYLYKNNSLLRITEDHTHVQELVNDGVITMAEARTHPQRNILTNAMGTKPELRIDTGKCSEKFNDADRILVCTDGLYDYLDDDELATALQQDSLEAIADYFIAEAKRRGGHDNITVALAGRKAPGQATRLKSTRDADIPSTHL